MEVVEFSAKIRDVAICHALWERMMELDVEEKIDAEGDGVAQIVCDEQGKMRIVVYQ